MISGDQAMLNIVKLSLAILIAAVSAAGIAAEDKHKNQIEILSISPSAPAKSGGKNEMQMNDTSGGAKSKSKGAANDLSPKQKKQQLPAVQKVREAAQPTNEKK
jgi:hypothetical protein